MNLLKLLTRAFKGFRRGLNAGGSSDYRSYHDALAATLRRKGSALSLLQEDEFDARRAETGAAGAALLDFRGVLCFLAGSRRLEPAGFDDPAGRLTYLPSERADKPGALKVIRLHGLTVVGGWVVLDGASWGLLTWHGVGRSGKRNSRVSP